MPCAKMKKTVAYSFEHGDESLPHLKALVSETEDPDKSRILSYLRIWQLPIYRPKLIPDEITPGKTIGAGSLFTDGIYLWNDAFVNYVDKYNIPVPKEFREHIMTNYDSRMQRHALLDSIDCVEIHSRPYEGFTFDVRIYKNGVIKYRNNIESKDEVIQFITPEDAKYIIGPLMTELFCYDTYNHGLPVIDGYYWGITFYKNAEELVSVEGWPGEDQWRLGRFIKVIENTECLISQTLGSEYMHLHISGQ